MWNMSDLDDAPSRLSMSVSMYRGGGGGYGRPKTAPPDLPSLLLDSRICYLGMPVSDVLSSTLLLPDHPCVGPLTNDHEIFDLLIFWLVQIVPAVTELIVAELLWLDYDNPGKPIYFYINSSGTQVFV
jgi:ATP-dependent Clp protease protease subunit